MKRIIFSVTNDLTSEQRVHRIAISLINSGYEVLLIGRKLKKSQPLTPRQYPTKRLKLIFTTGPLFYLEFNIRLFYFLIFSKCDIMVANDLDTLFASFIASKIRRKKLIYDSHEYFTEVPELFNRKLVRSIWLTMEKLILPRIKTSYTVCKSIADIYNQKYGISMQVIRNLPFMRAPAIDNSCTFTLPKNKKIIIYQGAVNVGRGLEPLINAMPMIENSILLIVGDGDIKTKLEEHVKKLQLEETVLFTGKIPFEKLPLLTQEAHLGVSIEQNIGLNYYYALPNKIFDYIQSNVPVLGSPFPEISRIIKNYEIGLLIENWESKHIAEKINKMLTAENEYKKWKTNLLIAAKDLCWNNEEKKLLQIYST